MATPLDHYDYELPASLIAQHPLEARDQSRLMVLPRGKAGCSHHGFSQLPALLPPGALLVVNNTLVAPRRLRGLLPGGTAVEVLLMSTLGAGVWQAMVKKARRLKAGVAVSFGGGAFCAEALRRTPEGHWLLRFAEPEALPALLREHGLAPLPPYIRRNGGASGQDARDRETYQTCFARVEGAIAAPTAGLHFTPAVLAALAAAGVEQKAVTLHVGWGTFAPIKVSDAEQHTMGAEWYHVPPPTAQAILAARAQGRPVIAVGTTTVRALESWALEGSPPGGEGWSGLFIRPPFRFQVVDGLVTNFHQPRSTLLMLVSAFHGRELVLEAYREAVREGYRFFSFGDCMAMLPHAAAGPGA